MKELLLLAILLPTVAQAASIDLSWDKPETNPTEYYVYMDGAKRQIVDGNVTTATIADVSPGKHSIYLTAVNEWGESGASNTVLTPDMARAPVGLKWSFTVTVTGGQ